MRSPDPGRKDARPEPPAAWRRFCGGIPDPPVLLAIMIAFIIVVSAVAAAAGWSTVDARFGNPVVAETLLSLSALRRLLEEAPRLIIQFPPIWQMLVMIVGVAVAERSGLFRALSRQLIAGVGQRLLSPSIFLLALLGHQIGDASLLILPPLAASAFMHAGRHPLAGIAISYAGISGALAANLIPGQHDVVLLSLTAAAAQLVDPLRQVSPLANWWFTAAVGAVFLPIAWWTTDRLLEPRLQLRVPIDAEPIFVTVAVEDAASRTGVRRSLAAMLSVLAALAGAVTLAGLGSASSAALIVGGLMLMLLSGGCVYGITAGTVRSLRDVVRMVASGLFTLRIFLAAAALASVLVALLSWSNLALLAAAGAAETLEPLRNAPVLALLAVAGAAALLDLFVPSASAKWAVLAPIAIPSLMLLGTAPEMTTAAYRLGDSVFNIIVPTSASFALILTLCRSWTAEFRVASLVRMMLPYSLGFVVAGLTLISAWSLLDLPLGPGL